MINTNNEPTKNNPSHVFSVDSGDYSKLLKENFKSLVDATGALSDDDSLLDHAIRMTDATFSKREGAK